MGGGHTLERNHEMMVPLSLCILVRGYFNSCPIWILQPHWMPKSNRANQTQTKTSQTVSQITFLYLYVDYLRHVLQKQKANQHRSCASCEGHVGMQLCLGVELLREAG